MKLTELSAEDQAVFGACLRCAVEGPYLPDGEFAFLTSRTRDEMRQVADSWPEPPKTIPEDCISAEWYQRGAATGAANSLLSYPHGFDQSELEADLGVSVAAVCEALDHLFGRHNNRDGPAHLDNLQ